MSHIPLHRRILPWIYVAVFLSLAPVLVFYTAGYRYNSKKGSLERHGTLIVDTIPKGAEVFIDGQTTEKKTPVTFQDMTPGWHTIRVEKEGFTSWEKTLDIKPEHVTFANRLWLWKQNQNPKLILPINIRQVSVVPTEDALALLLEQQGSLKIAWYSNETHLSPFVALPKNATSTSWRWRWQERSRAFALQSTDQPQVIYWGSRNKTTTRVEQLPTGWYHWDGDVLLGEQRTQHTVLNPKQQTLRQEARPASLLGFNDEVRLETPRLPDGPLILKQDSWLNRAFALPQGNWMIYDRHPVFALLNDHSRWLAADFRAKPPSAHTISGDYPRWLLKDEENRALLTADHEVWLWEPERQTSTLLWRQSEPVKQVVWHRDGTVIFIATRHQIISLHLDERAGRLTTALAEFEAIEDIAVFERDIYIAGTKNQQSGLWRLEIEEKPTYTKLLPSS